MKTIYLHSMNNSQKIELQLKDLILKYMEAYIADDDESADDYLKQIDQLKELCDDC